MKNEEGFVTRFQHKIGKGMAKGLDYSTGKDVSSIKNFVDRQKALHPELNDVPLALANRMVKKRQWYAATTSFIWGLGGWWTLIPNLANIWRIHGRLTLTIAYIYGYDLNDPERREEIAICFALSSASEAVNKMLREAGMIGAKKALLTKASKEFIKTLPNKLATIAGKKSLTNVSKIVPVAGGIIGGVIDFFSTKGVGKAAIAFYS